MFGFSKLAQKMWSTVADKGIGGALKPWQMKREGLAALEIERYRKLVLAQTDSDVDKIKKGEASLILGKNATPILIENSNTISSELAEPYIDIEKITSLVSRDIIAAKLAEDINVTKALFIADDILSKDSSEPTSEDIDEDWLYRWRKNASEIKTEELQQLWGGILAGEVKSPGSFSLRTLDFIKNLSKSEAIAIEKLYKFTFLDRVITNAGELYGDIYLDQELSFNYLIKLQDLGIVSGVEAMGLRTTLGSQKDDHYFRYVIYDDIDGKKIITFENENKEQELVLNVILLTSIGVELGKLCKQPIDTNYLKFIINTIKNKSFDVKIGSYFEHNGHWYVRNPVKQ
ncbi:TPA: DUF2806 domain-containing protein [Morganella morganii]|nr:DUF2806 domain-containing protein [Morganella morganii]